MTDREWLFRLVLRAYPPEFRGAYGVEMLMVHRAQRRDGVGGARYWLACIADTCAAAPGLWGDELRDGFRSTARAMKTMGVVAAIAGVLETANSVAELSGAPFNKRDLLARALLALVIATGVLLFIAGLAILFRGHAARRVGFVGAWACLGAFSLMVVTRPMMSIAASGLGITVPLAMWFYLASTRKRHMFVR